ncbi:proto-oncogene tyrosine-protein kinase receptor Ret [Tribolium madens]|uniref:proto-oncogene tyrosine-protein kinase receptor Ret n=1 Tax=Tribolium madens TaxID=41895 RepID=UPI001CF7278A|nr:proto-oncogene tyrosine-protein kinase receptor Ret [Tribolium madens]
MLFILFTFFTFANGVYFSMSDINITIPIDKGKFPLNKQPLASFLAHGDPPLNFSINNNLLKITQTGDVFFSPNFPNFTKVDSISAQISVRDNSNKEATTHLNLDFVLLDSLDCDLIVEELCFWKTVRYNFSENAKPGRVGSLASPFLVEMCASCEINYNLLSKNKEFRVGSSGALHSIESTEALDRETQSLHLLEVSCSVENSKHTLRSINQTLVVAVGDVDDNPPKAQERSIKINMSSKHVHKDQVVAHKDLIFSDRDSSAVNKYKPVILNDTLKILKAQCNKFSDDHLKQEVQTAVHCKLKFTKTVPVKKSTYSVVLQLNDTSLVNGNGAVNVPIDLQFLDDSGHHPGLYKRQLKPTTLYPSNKIQIFRTAAPLARLTQPRHLHNSTNFTLTPLLPKHHAIFNVTYIEGIIFVHDSENLRNATEFVRVNISWMQNDSLKSDEIQIQIVDEPTKTCNDVRKFNDWEHCAQYTTPEECLSPRACALATGGSSSVEKRKRPQRCMWRGEKTPSNEPTTLYATCTPDVETCPDEKCDELEQLESTVCPQDCAEEVLFPAERNKMTGRGIFRGSGVCFCSTLQCHCNPLEYVKVPKRRKPTKPPETTPFLANSSRHTSNVTKIMGIELAKCGTTCIFGVIGGVLFLGAAVALFVICWKLDSVHKAVRDKFGEENQDLAAPLSDYIDRSMPEPPLNFEMTTSLADTAILGIINKYAPDPKWEFPRNQLIIEQTLGEGEFGKVLRAKALNIAGTPGETTVAVKTLKDDAREPELNDLLSEYQLLKEVSHPNVIRLLGVCTAPGGPIYLIIEFAEHGSLRNYLRRSRHLKSECGRLPSSTVDDSEVHYDEPNISKVTPKEILSFAWQICKGMAYLSEIKLVHRDLAARNVLLAADRICKISDFGLTRDIYEDDAYFKRSKGRVPVKWMAPESLSDHIYTNKSDVWSFGILVWELVTLGATPYPGIAVQNLFHLLRQGYRMERPDNCSPTLYNIMRSCWHIDPEQRPTFQELATLWEKMLSDEVQYLDLANNAIHNRSYFCSPFEEKPETDPVNYLSKSQSYIKCGSADKFQESAGFLAEPDDNQNDINARGYETPVKVPKKVVHTPTNDCPQYYTDMASGKST